MTRAAGDTIIGRRRVEADEMIVFPILLPATVLGRAVGVAVFIVVGGVGLFLTFLILGLPEPGEGVTLDRLIGGAFAVVIAYVVGLLVGLRVDRRPRRR